MRAPGQPAHAESLPDPLSESRLLVGGRAALAGAAAGVCSLLLEAAFGLRYSPAAAHPLHAGAVAAYGLFGVLSSLVARAALANLSTFRRRVLIGILLGSILVPGAVYHVNAELLPGLPWSAPRSLATTCLVFVVAAVVGLSMAAAYDRHSRGPRPLTKALGVAGLLAAAGLGALLAAAAPSKARTAPAVGTGPDLILIVLDAVRRDHLGLYGYARATSPRMDAFSRGARVFREALSPSSWTLPTMQRMLWPDASWPRSAAEELAGAGYVTATFSDNGHSHPGASFLRGFQLVGNGVAAWRSALLRDTAIGIVLTRLDPVDDVRLTDRALAFLAETADRPVFLYVHLMSAHAPYRFPPIDGRPRPERVFEFPDASQRLTEEEKQYVVAAYDSGILQADRQLGRILDAVAQRPRPRLVLVTADHGESLGEQNRWTHGGSLAGELLRVPLVVGGIGISPGTVEAPLSTGLVGNTLLCAAQLPCTAAHDLRSGTIAAEVTGGLPPRLAYRFDEGLKLEKSMRSGRLRLFDWRADPFEVNDLASQQRQVAEEMAKGLEAAAAWRLGPSGDPVDNEAKERLRALGYTGF